MRATARIILVLLVSITLDVSLSVAATMNDYCIVPPFIQEIAKPNLLMIIDNSASMYDLAYDDKGSSCSVTKTKSCSDNEDCPSGETCLKLRNPSYCFDETFSNANSYVGYFDSLKKYKFNFSTNRFQEVASIPGACSMAAVADRVYCKTIGNTLLLNIDKADQDPAHKFLYASGKFLNWLISSKFDVEKEVLTGGKYVTKVCSNNSDKSCLTNDDCGTGNSCNVVSAFLQPESRGCVGMGYVKDINTADFQNYATGTANPNIPLELTFLVKGPSNPNNSVAPSTGGQTYLEIFSKTGTSYDYEACQRAIESIATGGNADIKKDVDSCLASSGTTLGVCQQNSALQCAASYGPSTPNCDFPIVSPNPYCSTAASRSCTKDTEIADCTISESKTCTAGNLGVICAEDNDCDVKVCSGNADQSCSDNSSCLKITKGYCQNKQQSTCSNDTDCISGKTNNGPCVNPPFNWGTCGIKTEGVCTSTSNVYTGPCVTVPSGYVGPCVLTDGVAATRTKVSFNQSMQACWALRNGKAIGTDEINTVKNQCADIYGSYRTCSNNANQTCTGVAGECGTGTCLDGPAAIQAGNPGIICSSAYAGQLMEKNTNNAWVIRSTMPAATPGACLASDTISDCMIKIHTQFCSDIDAPVVTDPTNPPSTSTATENLPAILSGIGVEAQLGAPILSLPVRLETPAPPTGLVQEYANKIRIGLMSFNTYGSASEVASGLLSATKVCFNDSNPVVPTQFCTQDIDCDSGSSCEVAPDVDAAIIDSQSLIGIGKCSVTTTTECTKKAHCPGEELCVSNGAGSHTTAGLISSIDSLRGSTWTPFAEAFYNAIGYFAVSPSDSTGKSSRTDMRLNETDFPANMNPSEYVCQANNILLITDGSSTADQNSSKTGLVNVYKSLSGNVTGACTKYAGSQDLDDMAWLARQRNINTFSKSAASSDLPQKKNQSITSYVVFNGSDNGETGDCNNTTLLTKTAANGGTSLLKTDIPEQYEATLRRAFEQVAGGTASGTAASILSNSEGSGANILQAVFYPSKDFEKETGQIIPTSASWIGEMQNLWYYVDPFVGNSSVREDTNINKNLDIKNDYVVEFQFMGGETIAALKKDTDGDGDADIDVTSGDDSRVKNQGYCINSTTPTSSSNAKCTSNVACQDGEACVVQGVISADDISSLWRAGKQLWNRNLATAPRKLYTHLYGKSLSGCAGAFSINGMFDLGNWSTLGANDKCIVKTLLQAADDVEALNIIKFVQGYDHSSYDTSAGAITGTIDSNTPRSRSVQIGGVKKVWKLGDIIASTPRIQSYNKLNNFHMDAPVGYGDTTYADDSSNKGFANSDAYKARGMAYTGANDGMLHAFTLGKLNVSGSGDQKATLTGTGLGEEAWSFIPSNVLPYLKYLADPEYSHLFLVDGPTRLIDASIGYNDNSYISNADRAIYAAAGCNATGSGEHTAYWACRRDGTTTTDAVTNQSWRSILIGSMGVGGASANKDTGCTNCVETPVDGVGYSSYFALDITDPGNPTYLWEFSHAELGYATSGAGIARVSHKFSTANDERNDTNGRWFAVIGNGPTGPIDTTYHQFKGKSLHDLGVFVLDLKSGILQRKLATSIPNAFAGSMSTAPIDTDRSKKYSSGFYSDDALYFGYTNCTNNCDAEAPTWNGGIMRLLTDENIDPDTWSLTTLLSNTGPINTSVNKLQDRKNHNLWLYTGTGRYFFKGDDSTAPGKILAVKEPCYNKVNDDLHTLVNATANGCANEIVFAAGDFADQTTVIDAVDDKKGWFITLVGEDTANNYGAERIITEPVAMPNGAVFFTSFMPSTDVCNFGGNSYLWGMRYDTGGAASPSQLKGKALVQVSTGSFEEINLSSALTANMGRKMGTPMVGKPPTDPPPIVSGAGNKPLKRIMHVREK